jgi:hypothetical protein
MSRKKFRTVLFFSPSLQKGTITPCLVKVLAEKRFAFALSLEMIVRKVANFSF